MGGPYRAVRQLGRCHGAVHQLGSCNRAIRKFGGRHGVIRQLGALNPEESVDLATLIEAYTANGAWIMHQEDEVGSIEVGKTADLVVLEKNLFEIPPQEIGEVRVLETFVNGESVFRAR